MSTITGDAFNDEIADGVAEAAAVVAQGPQRLSEMRLTECRVCHSRVYFRARSSTPTNDPHFRVDYLFCPCCGASATRLREVEIIPQKIHRKAKVKYRYNA